MQFINKKSQAPKPRGTDIARLAAYLGVTTSTIYAWLSGKRSPKTLKFHKLMEAFNLPANVENIGFMLQIWSDPANTDHRPKIAAQRATQVIKWARGEHIKTANAAQQ